jgi:RimJ/RimL family protein N-acetyltransferase
MKVVNLQISSERLLLRPIGAADLKELHRLWNDELVRRFLWDGKVVPLEQTEAIVERNNQLFENFGFGLWGVREHNLEELLGFAGYWHFRAPPSLELLFGVKSHHWNRGIATESSRCVIRYGFEVLGFRTVEARMDVANAASIKVLEKLGMSFQRRAVLDGLDTIFYALRFDEWRKVNQASARGNAPGPGSGA